MLSATSELIQEHKAILTALDILDSMSSQISRGHRTDTEDIGKIVDFLKIFADKCHHGKEEGMLFPALVNAGFSLQNGPVAVMLYEHDEGRKLISDMTKALASVPFDDKLFLKSAFEYTGLLRNHIEKENQVLFPMSDMRLSPATHQALLKKFGEFEEEVIGNDKHEQYHAMLKELQAKYY